MPTPSAPGHLPLFMAGTELIEISPTDEFTTVEVVMANLAAMTAAGASS